MIRTRKHGDMVTRGQSAAVFPASPTLRVPVSVFIALLLIGAAPEIEPVKIVDVSPELRVSIAAGEEVFLSARPLPNETVDAFVQRLTEDPKAKKEILAQNQGLQLRRREIVVRVPYTLLSDNYWKIAMEALFPEDRADPAGWTHLVTAPAGHPESLWRIAEWFTGDGSNYREIRSQGNIASLATEVGQAVRIPARLLLPAFRNAAASASTPAALPESPLEFGQDEKGRYAVYRLKKGEALYSSVVI